MKIDLSYMTVDRQYKIYKWFHDNFGNYGTREKWNYHHWPSKDKYWIEIQDDSVKTFWLLQNL